MKRIISSLSLIAIVLVGITVGGTKAFFSDTESSVANNFTSGAIDLKVDNESYYNGFLNASTTWEATDLTIEKFFDFPDLKPDDYGEDTISLHVETNDAYLCANVKLTSNDDNSQTEPERLVDGNGASIGELASLVNFIWWADDGDNVLESDENIISQGPIGALGVGGSTTIALADSETNIWTGEGGPVPGDETLYIGKAWCFGNIGEAKITQDNSTTTMSPAGNNNGNGKAGEPEDGGFTCDGSALGNESQTDSLTADVTFEAVQARHNGEFLCKSQPDPDTQIVVTKVVINDNGGNNVVSDFELYIDDGIVGIQVLSGVTTTIPAGQYNVTEAGIPGYVASFSGDCDAFGQISIANGETKHCVITNDDLPGSITLRKVVTGILPLANPALFQMRIDGGNVPQLTSVAVTANSPHTISEVQRLGYSFVSMTGVSSYGKSCPAVLGGSITLDEGESILCTITNQKNPI